jgi:hypothetical protein
MRLLQLYVNLIGEQEHHLPPHLLVRLGSCQTPRQREEEEKKRRRRMIEGIG